MHPKERMIFEEALLRPPKHLVEQIQELRGPIRELNRQFIRQLVKKMPLRPEVDSQMAAPLPGERGILLPECHAELSGRPCRGGSAHHV